MNRKELCDFFNEIETTFPVSKWKINELHIWPLLRIKLGFSDLNDIYRKPRNTQKPSKSFHIKDFIFPLLYKIKSIINLEESNQISKKHNINISPLNQIDILCMSPAQHRSFVNRKMFNRFIDPIIDELKFDYNIFLLELNYGIYHTAINHNSEYCIPIEPILNENFSIFYDKNFKYDIQLERYNEFYNLLIRNVPDLDLSSFKFRNIAQELEIERLIHTKNYFKELLIQKQVKLVVVTCYYAFDCMALLAASKELCIKTIDIQHGISDEFHFANGKWNNFPTDGFEMLPNYFWLWNEKESMHMIEWKEKSGGAPKRLIGGNPWLELWQKNKIELGEEITSIILKLKEKIKNKKVIMYALETNPFIPQIIPNYMLESIKDSPDDWFWLIRLHPGQLDEKNNIEKLIGNLNLTKGFEISSATSLPLPAVLMITEVNITLTSSVVLEALYYNISSVVTHPDGKNIYKNEIANGTVLFSGEYKDKIIECLYQLLNQKTENHLNVESNFQQTLFELIN